MQILQENSFSQNIIHFIQDIPIDWGSGSKELGMHKGRNLKFFLDNTVVHYRGASNYAPKSALGIDMDQFQFDKTKAFEKFLKNILNE